MPSALEPPVIVAMKVDHWSRVEAIYAAGIGTGHATFETAPPSWDRFDATRLPGHRHVALGENGRVVGWTAASAASDRCVYGGVVEHAVYVDLDARGRGVGRLLLEALVVSTEESGIWTIQSGVFPENGASLAAHAAAGFRVVGTRVKIAKMTFGPMAGKWRDVIAVERRSRRIC